MVWSIGLGRYFFVFNEFHFMVYKRSDQLFRILVSQLLLLRVVIWPVCVSDGIAEIIELLQGVELKL